MNAMLLTIATTSSNATYPISSAQPKCVMEDSGGLQGTLLRGSIRHLEGLGLAAAHEGRW